MINSIEKMFKQSRANGFTGSGDRADGMNIKVQFEQRLEVGVVVGQIALWSKSIYTQRREGAHS